MREVGGFVLLLTDAKKNERKSARFFLLSNLNRRMKPQRSRLKLLIVFRMQATLVLP